MSVNAFSIQVEHISCVSRGRHSNINVFIFQYKLDTCCVFPMVSAQITIYFVCNLVTLSSFRSKMSVNVFSIQIERISCVSRGGCSNINVFCIQSVEVDMFSEQNDSQRVFFNTS